MRQIKNQKLEQLLMQLRFTPKKKRKKQLDSAEKLLAIIEPDKEYPFEFVCFRITGFHPKEPIAGQLIKGDELADDLRIFISKLSGQVAEPVVEQKEKVYSVKTLAEAFDISTKTIHRWRKQGLNARKFIFEDGVKRLGFLQSSVDRFVKKKPRLVSNAKTFIQVTSKQKQWIIKQATLLTAKTTLSRHQIINQIAAKIGRSHETIRYTIANYEKANPDKANFGRSRSSIFRIIKRQRARNLLAKRIEFVASDEFLQQEADKIIAEPISGPEPTLVKDTEPLELASESLLPQYLQALRDTPVLNREREAQLFRRYNYLKYLACVTRAGIKLTRIRSKTCCRQH
jgi:RNA polymerase primary sigma factor